MLQGADGDTAGSSPNYFALDLSQAADVSGCRYNVWLILAVRYNLSVGWDVEVTDEFKAWWGELTEAERISVGAVSLAAGGARPPSPISVQ